MAIELDHLMVPSRDKIAGARLLAELLDVRWSATGIGPFAPVFVSDTLTLDFDQWSEPVPAIHYCFRMPQPQFDATLARIKARGIPFGSAVHSASDGRVGSHNGGSIVYWNQPDGHMWEMLTVSYARAPAPPA
jgi:catechol 2,3-dioxygenase-like lactoylglutathione lyase family enzyme